MIYRHRRDWNFSDDGAYIDAKGGLTIAIEDIPIWAYNDLKPGTFFEKKIGVAKCHPEENFCKATGRAEAEKKMKARKFTVVSVFESLDERRIVFDVEGFGEAIMVRYANSKRVRLV